MTETIKVYQGADTGASQSLVTLEGFISALDGAELWEDNSTIDASDAVTAINGLIFSLESRDTEIARLRATIRDAAEAIERRSTSAPVLEALRAALSVGHTD